MNRTITAPCSASAALAAPCLKPKPLSCSRLAFTARRAAPSRMASVQVRALSQDELKQQAAWKAVEYVSSGMVLGLGTGSTAAYASLRGTHDTTKVLQRLGSDPWIGDLLESGELKDIIGVPTSERTYEQAKGRGIPLATLSEQPKLDLAIDGADEVDPFLNVVKGRGGALLREKMVEMASAKFVCIVDDTKLVKGLGGSGDAMPVEIVQFCWKYNLERLQNLPEVAGCKAKLRENSDGSPYVTDNSNYIVDLYFDTPIKDAKAAAAAISGLEGVVDHGLFLDMVDVCIIAAATGVEVREK